MVPVFTNVKRNALKKVQAVEVKLSLVDLDALSQCANQPNFSPNFLGHDIPCVILLFVFGVKVLKSFGYGLKERLNKKDDQGEITPQTPVPLVQIWDDLETEPGPKKWTIDD
ncbi:16326_t:CDS:2 [Cetraspora pellucida]|uniref:16326_t:CDS:1 n=1 Tax=Cetraspora pellucida TaxID=1433469 RepID=A0A9N9DFT7_9GLOM|nr:16326_t:CDS:2 [Cetraspora pellucida]